MDNLLQKYGDYKAKRFPELERKSTFFLKKILVQSMKDPNNNSLQDMIDHFIAIGILVDRDELQYPMDLIKAIGQFEDDINYNRI